MAASRVAACMIIMGIFHGILGATLNDNGQMMRHERKEASVRALEMSSHAEFTTVHSSQDPAGIGRDPQSDDGSSGHDFCDYDYIFGNQNSNHCDNRSTTWMSDLKDSECLFAKDESGAQKPDAGFEIPQEWNNVRPKGCFAAPCQNKKGWCYYENEDGAIPNGNMSGYPVCRRFRYLYGVSVADADINDARICPHSEYMVIAGQSDCLKAANCLGDCAGEEFRIGIHNKSKHDEFPPGCFLHAHSTTGRSCVYWNDPNEAEPPNTANKLNKPRYPSGSPICVVRQQDHVRNLGAGGPSR